MILVSKAFHSYKTSTSGLLEIPEKTAAVANKWSGREDSNLRPPGPEPGALPG